jgi:hypothetical protein
VRFDREVACIVEDNSLRFDRGVVCIVVVGYTVEDNSLRFDREVVCIVEDNSVRPTTTIQTTPLSNLTLLSSIV